MTDTESAGGPRSRTHGREPKPQLAASALDLYIGGAPTPRRWTRRPTPLVSCLSGGQFLRDSERWSVSTRAIGPTSAITLVTWPGRARDRAPRCSATGSSGGRDRPEAWKASNMDSSPMTVSRAPGLPTRGPALPSAMPLPWWRSGGLPAGSISTRRGVFAASTFAGGPLTFGPRCPGRTFWPGFEPPDTPAYRPMRPRLGMVVHLKC